MNQPRSVNRFAIRTQSCSWAIQSCDYPVASVVLIASASSPVVLLLRRRLIVEPRGCRCSILLVVLHVSVS